MAYLEIEGLKKRLGSFVLDDLSLEVEKGEHVAILGPSGSGKTSLLRLISGILSPDSGSIRLGGKDIAGIPARERGVGMVFQDFALFPHYDVGGNVAYGPRSKGMPRGEIEATVREILARVGLEGFAARRVDQISGGERQRVALARALASRPQLVLFDEPFGSLDAALRRELRGQMLRFQKELGYTAISVTHDQEDALGVADRIIVMRNGHIIQSGSPEEIYRRPASAFVASFIGVANLLPGTHGDLVFFRPEDLEVAGGDLGSTQDGKPLLRFTARVRTCEYRGSDYLCVAQLEESPPSDISFVSTTRRAVNELCYLRTSSWSLLPDDR